ncbi:MAG: hypothetical protein C0608_04595 [Deltaproteobacteria bacterium]|nr:MAG: hypothetical protein C0608_04595 [Deltaproteobacteria bacterium]
MAIKETWEKALEYATSPQHGTLSRKQRSGVKLQINEGPIFESAVIFLGSDFVRVTESREGESVNTYYDWMGISSIRTFSKPTS